MSGASLKSRGLLAFQQFLEGFIRTEKFTSLQSDMKRLKADLAGIEYCVHIKGSRVRVRKYDEEIDYSADVEATFEKFKQGAVQDYRVTFPNWPSMNHVEEQILGFVALLYPEIFERLDTYCDENGQFIDQKIRGFDREIQFYISYLDYIAPLKKRGLPFCYPQLSTQSKHTISHNSFDLALAHKLMLEDSAVVCNDFYLRDQERIIVVSGPNQGGKTTFARAFGQIHHLASLGCPVPGSEAKLFLVDAILTHFEKLENIVDLRGKLEDDLIRIEAILDQATPDSLIIMNEIFTSTSVEDAVFLGGKVMERIIELDALCVCVTFIDEWASLSEKTISMVSTVVPENTALRTYKIVRRPADGLSYALSIAEKYGLTYDRLKARITS